MEFRQASVGSRGRLTIPVEYRKALGFTVGDAVVLELGEGVLNVRTRESAINRAQELVARHTASKRSLVDELVKERRGEATRE